MASSAAILAIGKPVALLARAEERETRGFISMTTMRPVFGSTANWMFDPPVSTPTSRMMRREALRMAWYSRSVRVWAGATVTESPVWMPMGSKFSMEQMTTKLSAPSLITSSSYSFQPVTDSSTRISWTGERSRPRETASSNPSARQLHREVQRGLAPHGGQHRVGPLALQHRLQHLGGQGLDVGPVRVLGVRHDGGGVRVHERYPDAFLLQDLDGLGAGVVELAGLPDHDRPRADHEHGLEGRIPGQFRDGPVVRT